MFWGGSCGGRPFSLRGCLGDNPVNLIELSRRFLCSSPFAQTAVRMRDPVSPQFSAILSGSWVKAGASNADFS
jgi:hypothetical protein